MREEEGWSIGGAVGEGVLRMGGVGEPLKESEDKVLWEIGVSLNGLPALTG